jgi:hypothetical protein
MARSAEADARYRATMAKKKAKLIEKNSLQTMAAETPTVVYREYYCHKDMQNKLFTDATADRWAKELVEWAKKPDSLKFSDWFLENDIHMSNGLLLCDIYPALKNAAEQAKMIIGNRREKGGIKNELNSAMVSFSMPMYDPEWKARVEWDAKIKKDAAQVGNVHVTIERFPSTDKVPTKPALSGNDKTED